MGLGILVEKAMAPHSSTLAWKIPWMEEPGGLQSMGSQRVGHDWVTSLSIFTFMHWRRKWQPSPVFLPGESQGRRSLVGCYLWGLTESDTTEETSQQRLSSRYSGGHVFNCYMVLVKKFASSKHCNLILLLVLTAIDPSILVYWKHSYFSVLGFFHQACSVCFIISLKFLIFLTVMASFLSSVQFSRSVVSDYLQPHEPQHARPPCPSPTPRVHPKPCPLSWWCHSTISSSVIPFSSCPQSFPSIRVFSNELALHIRWPKYCSFSFNISPSMNIQDWFPLRWIGWISLHFKGLSRVFSNNTVQKHKLFSAQLSL